MLKKVLLIQGSIPHYRVPVFNELAKRTDLTVIYSEGELPEGIEFKVQYIPTVRCHFLIHKKNLYNIAKKFDAVICTFNFAYLYARILYLLPHKYKLIFWGIGVSAGYSCRYDSNQEIAQKLCKAINKSDATVFYCDYPVQKYSKMGVDKKKLFVANNTVKVSELCETEKTTILFVGSLYKAKKIDFLLNNYKSAFLKNPAIPELVIIGYGEEYQNIAEWIKKEKLDSKIILCGKITDDDKLSEYFAKAIICISPDQAGLSVLKSMGNGVPYITHKDSITGGEIFNIKHGENGVLINDFNELEDIILDCAKNKAKYIEMGQKAKSYYYKNRTVPQMVDGFVDAIEYACNHI